MSVRNAAECMGKLATHQLGLSMVALRCVNASKPYLPVVYPAAMPVSSQWSAAAPRTAQRGRLTPARTDPTKRKMVHCDGGRADGVSWGVPRVRCVGHAPARWMTTSLAMAAPLCVLSNTDVIASAGRSQCAWKRAETRTLRLESGVLCEHVHREGMVPAPEGQHKTGHPAQEAHPPGVYDLEGFVDAVHREHR